MVETEDSMVSPTAVDGPVGVVAVVGRPNVGKSTLVGRLSGRRGPIVGPVSGLTRDRLDVEASWQGTSFVLQDTGGIVEEALGRDGMEGLQGRVADQAVGAIGAADVVLFVVDAIVGVTSDEVALAERLPRQKADRESTRPNSRHCYLSDSGI